MVSDVNTKIWYKALTGKFAGSFVSFSFKIPSLAIFVRVSGMGLLRTYEYHIEDVRKLVSVLKAELKKEYGKAVSISRITPEYKDRLLAYLRQRSKTAFRKYASKKAIKFEKTVIVGKTKPTAQEQRKGTRFYNENLRDDVPVKYSYYETAKKVKIEIDFETDYRNHPTFIMLPLGINELYNPAKYKNLFLSGQITQDIFLSKGETRQEIIETIDEKERIQTIPFAFNFYDMLFGNKKRKTQGVQDYWLVPPTYDKRGKKVSDGIQPVGMVTYAIRNIVENRFNATISGHFQRKTIKQIFIQWYRVVLNVEADKVKDDTFHQWYKKEIEKIKMRMRDFKKEKKKEQVLQHKRAVQSAKEKGFEVKKQERPAPKGFKSKKSADRRRAERRGTSKRKKR